jgi:outer membrane protein assembly factor BamB
VRTGGDGLITDTHVAWRVKRGVPNKPSILLVDDLIYMIGDAGIATVLKPGRVFEKLAENRLDEGLLASPAIAGKALYLRTRTHLYRIEEK